MSTTVAVPLENLADDRAQPGAAVRRTAFYLQSRGEPLFAWLHSARDRSNVNHGVVICPPIGFEQQHAHRSLRHLADVLARQGIPTLRFDWHGTGDSSGRDEDPNRYATWHHNVRDTVGWMRSHLGCRLVSIVGLRMGAALAAEALGEDDCDNFVFWAPITSGTLFVRQMQTIEQLAELRPRSAAAAPGDLEAAGYVLTEETAARIAKSNLLQSSPHCRRALLVAPFDKRLADRFAAREIPVDQVAAPGYAEMMAEPHYSKVPQQAIDEIVAWLAKKVASDAVADLAINEEALGPKHMLLAWQTQAEAESTVPSAVRERAFHFGAHVGAGASLFGIVSESAALTDALPTIVLLNAGSANRVGPGRFNVHLARYLAVQGFRCVRIDARGLGDSPAADAADENNPYPSTVFRDLETVIEQLRGQWGIQRCVLLGLCSGAYAAFQAAAQLSDPSLVESVLINPLTFFWKDGMPFDASQAQQKMKEHCYMARVFNRQKLWKFLTGKTEIGYLGALRILQSRLQELVAAQFQNSTTAGPLTPIAEPTHPLHEDLPGDLQRVVAAGRRLAMFLAEGDPGYAVLTYHARREAKRLLKSGSLHLSWIKEADHTFSRRSPRQELFRTLTDYLHERYCGTSSGGSRSDLPEPQAAAMQEAFGIV